MHAIAVLVFVVARADCRDCCLRRKTIRGVRPANRTGPNPERSHSRAHLFAAELERSADTWSGVDSRWKRTQLFRNEGFRQGRQDGTLGDGRGVRGAAAPGGCEQARIYLA